MEGLAAFDCAVEGDCAKDSAEGLLLIDFTKACPLEEFNKSTGHVVLCVLESIEKLDEQKQTAHENVRGTTPIRDV